MNKKEFTRELKNKIKHLPKSERRQILSYYYEMISERMEDGMTEAEAIAALGSIDELVANYLPTKPVVAERRSPRLRAWHIVMLIVGSPLWICLLAAMFVILLAFYIVIWALVLVCYVVFAALAVSAFACFAASFISLFTNGPAYFFALMGAGCILGGLALLWLMPCNLLAKGMAKLTAKTSKGIFRFFFKRR